MHIGGNEIISDGFTHVVEITNVITHNPRVFHNYAKQFIEQCDFTLQPPNLTQRELPYIFENHEYRITVQDGELPGYGIYVFCKTEEGKSAAQRWYAGVQI